MLAWTIAASLVVGTAVLGAASLRPPGFTTLLLAVYVLAMGEVVLLTEFLSLFDGVGATGYTIGHLCLLVVAVAAWNHRGRPLPRIPALRPRSVLQHRVLLLLALVVAVAVGYQAFLVLATPPNTWDSLAYHLARAAEWSQRGGVDYYPTHSESVNAPQPNAEMLILHTFAFAQRDTFAAAPQLIAELASVVAVYGIATRLGFARAAAAFAALLAATLPQVALQSVTTQNDLLTASFLASAIYFALGRSRAELALAGLALGLALGTKATAAIGLPLFLIALVVANDRRNILRGAALACAGFALLGAYGYMLNVVHTGRPLGDANAFGPLRRTELTFSGTASTAARITYRFVDLSGYPIAEERTHPLERAASRLFRASGIPLNPPDATVLEPPTPSPFGFSINRRSNEILSYFGPLGALVILPLSAVFVVAVVLRRVPPRLLIPALAIPVFILGVAVSTRYNAFNGRYILPAVVLTMPLAASLYRHRLPAATVAAVGALTLALVHVQNEYKPTGRTGLPPVWSMPRAEAQSIDWNAMARVIESVERHVPSPQRLGYVLRYNDWIYPYYGVDLRRRLVVLPPFVALEAADSSDLDAIIVADRLMPKSRSRAWRAIPFPDTGLTLLLREP